MRWRALIPVPLVVVTVVLALLQCGGWDGTVNGDGISYLDLAARYAHGRFDALANGYWSPLYPMLLGGSLRLAGVGGRGAGASLVTPEMRAVFAVNVVVMAAAAWACVRLLLALHRAAAPAPRAIVACRALAASALFVWCMIRFVGATSVTPDALLATWLLLITAELVDAAAGPATRRRSARLSVLLALGYWTKAVFFPVALLVLPAYLLATRHGAATLADRRAALVRAVVPALLLIAPLVIVQSVSQQRLSFGETGRLNYRWYVLGAPHAPATPVLADTRSEASDRPTTATVALASAPGTLLFRGDVPGTFPYWFDPSRFEPRAPTTFSAHAQWERLAYNAHWYRVVATPFVVLALVALLASFARARSGAATLVAMLPAAAMIALYALTHVEGRLAGPPIFVLLVLLLHPIATSSVVATVQRDGARQPSWRRLCAGIECAALVALAVLALGRTAKRVPTTAATLAARGVSPATELRANGVGEGSRLGIVGSPYGQYWAHQGGLTLSVVTPLDGRRAPVSDAELAAIASESCVRGTALAAIVGQRMEDVQSPRAVRLTSGWWMWRPTSPCTRGRTL